MFDLMFFDDRLAVPAIYGDSPADAVRYGARPVKLDLSTVLGAVAGATEHIGLGATTHDLLPTLPRGTDVRHARPPQRRTGRLERRDVRERRRSPETSDWTSTSNTTSATTGPRSFVEVVSKLWDSWEDDAIIADRTAGVFADPDKVHEVAHRGEYFTVRGPLTVPRTPQGGL